MKHQPLDFGALWQTLQPDKPCPLPKPDHIRDATKMVVDPTTRPQDRARLSRQCEQVLAWLQAGEVLTAAVAWERGCHRLAARCHDLRAAGHNITTTIERGSGTAEYRLSATGAER